MEKINYKFLKEEVYYEELENGLKVYFILKPNYNKTFGMLGTKYGSIDNCFVPFNGDDYITVPNGIAHFLEHKLFEMENGIDASMQFSKLGAKSNAFTTYDRTCYLFSTTSNVSECTKILLNLCFYPYFTDENILKEQGIIAQEINMYLDDSYFKAMSKIMLNLYSDNSVKDEIVGSVQSIRKIDKDLLYLCYNTFYQPGNMQLVLIGNLDLNLIEVIKENLRKKSFAPYKEIKRKYYLNDSLSNKKTEEESDITLPHVVVGGRFPLKERTASEQMAYEMMIPIILGALFSDSSDNYKILMRKKLINDSFGNFGSQDYYASYMLFYSDSEKPQEYLDTIIKMIEDIPSSKISKSLFLRTKNALIGSYISSCNSLEAIASNFLRYNFLGMNFFEAIKILENITYEDVLKCQKEFKDVIITSHTLLPKKG